MNRTAFAATLLCAAIALPCPAFALFAPAQQIQMLPPTPLGSNTVCPSGTQQVLAYSGAPMGGGEAGINCVPITTDAQGDMQASGYVQLGTTAAPCDATHAGSLRFNPASAAFEGCNGNGSWSSLGGGLGNLHQSDGETFYCDPGYQIVTFQFNCGCSNNAYFFECQPE